MKRIVLVLALVLPGILWAGEPARAEQPGKKFTPMKIGTWNTMLQPWLPYEDRVLETIASTNLDLLVLQEVWTEEAKDRIVSDARILAKYPHYYYTEALQGPGSCPFTPAFADADPFGSSVIASGPSAAPPAPAASRMVTAQAINDYISCLISTGIDTRTVEQPQMPINGLCNFIGLNIALDDQPCLACIVNTMQNLTSGDPGAFGARDQCFAGAGVHYAHGGQPGMLILSKKPLTNVQVTDFETYQIRRVNVYATVGGVRFGFTSWPHNVLHDIDPSLGPLQTGALQLDLANDVILRAPHVVLGDLNSGPDYQPAAYDLMIGQGYRPVLTNTHTYCPPQLQDFPPCGDHDAVSRSGDQIFLKKDAGSCLKTTFANDDASDHIGVAATCMLTTP